MQAYRELFELFDSLECDDVDAALSQMFPTLEAPPPLQNAWDVPVYRPDDWPGSSPPRPYRPYPEELEAENPWAAFDLTPDEALDDSPEPPRRKSRIVWSILTNILFFVVSLSVILGSVLFTFSKNPEKALFGYRVFRVETDSMTPTYQPDGSVFKGGFLPGDAIIVKLTDAHTVEVGDIITVNQTGQTLTLTHRVAEIITGYGQDETGIAFVTKGDHNAEYDTDPAPGSSLVGIKVLTLPYMGTVFAFAQANFIVTVALCALAVLLSFLLFLLVSCKKVTRRKVPELPELPEELEELQELYA